MARLPDLHFDYVHGDSFRGYVPAIGDDGAIMAGAATATGTIKIGTRPGTILYTFAGLPEVAWNPAWANADGTLGAFAVNIPAAALPLLVEGGRYHANFWVTPSGGTPIHQLALTISVKPAL